MYRFIRCKTFSLVKNTVLRARFKSIAALIIVYCLIATVEINIDITFVTFLILFSAITMRSGDTEDIYYGQ